MAVETFFNIAIAVIGVVVAIIGVVIAFFQYRADGLERKKIEQMEQERDNKKKIMENIAKKAQSVKELEEIVDLLNNISKQDFATETYLESFSLFQKLCTTYTEAKKSIELLYEELVKNESEFSLSYGYGRYIDAFRNFILLEKKVDELAADVFRMFNLAKKNAIQQEKGKKVDSKQFFEILKQAYSISEEIGEQVGPVIMLVKEIQMKYPIGDEK